MYLTTKQAARFLGVSENQVRRYLVSGRLSSERKGRQVLIPEAELRALAEAEKSLGEGGPKAESAPAMVPAFSPRDAFERIDARLAVLESQLLEKWQMVVENQRLQEQLRDLNRQLAEKELELEKLHRDLIYQQRLAAKEIEGHRLAFQEQLARMETAAAERAAMERERTEQTLSHERQSWTAQLAREREQAEQTLDQERRNWSERLAQEQERVAQTLAAARNREGFWARLVRMITWS